MPSLREYSEMGLRVFYCWECKLILPFWKANCQTMKSPNLIQNFHLRESFFKTQS